MARSGHPRPRSARSFSDGNLLSLQVLKQQRQCPLKDRRRVTARKTMAQKILHLPQLVVRLPIDGELHFVSFRGEWLDPRPPNRPRGFDSIVRSVLGQMEHAGAVSEHR
jgi:hypothetical protein